MTRALPRIVRALRSSARAAFDVLLSPRCPACGDPVTMPDTVCRPCWSRLTFIGAPCCAVCGSPFDSPAAAPVCAGCLADPPVWARARASLRYDDASRPLIVGFKHADRPHLAVLFAAWMSAAGGDLLDDAPLLVPVPLHRWRLLARRYNQAAELANALARRAALPVSTDALVRVRRTPSQGRLTASQRSRNVRGAFAVPQRSAPAIRDRRVLLIDDVLTTGATAGACARALMRAGAASVDLLTVARVVRAGLADRHPTPYLLPDPSGEA